MQVVLYIRSKSRTSAPLKLAGVRSVAEKAGWSVQIVDGIPDRRRMRQLNDFWRPAGCVVECGGEYGEIDTTVFQGVPTVFFDRNPATLPRTACAVSHDSQATGAMAARELLLTGYESFAFVHARETPFWSRERELGFRKALAINGRRPKTFTASGSDPIDYQRQLRRFLASLSTPAAIFAANDHTAAEVLTAIGATEGGGGVPGPVPAKYAVIGVDNYTEVCEHTQPPLSSIEPDFRGGGETAALMLMALMGGRGRFTGERHRTFGPLKVARRASTRVLKGYDPLVSSALELIAAESCQGLTAAKVLTLFDCSRDLAEIRFRRATGRSILQAIHEVRLERAKELLRNPSVQLKTISDFCGFRNPNSLRKFFLKRTGMTMSRWRSSPERR